MANKILNMIMAVGATAFMFVALCGFVGMLATPTLTNDQFLQCLVLIAAGIVGTATCTAVAVNYLQD
jgi:hypothetical protein